MLGTMLHGPGDVRCEEVPEPKILKPTDAVIRLSASCICGSDLWPYRGLNPVTQPHGDGSRVLRRRRRGRQRRHDRQAGPVRRRIVLHLRQHLPALPPRLSVVVRVARVHDRGAGAGARVPLADGTLVATPTMPPDDLIPSLLAVSDVLGTGWYAADAARVQADSTVAVVGDRAVGLMGVLAARQMGAGRIIVTGTTTPQGCRRGVDGALLRIDDRLSRWRRAARGAAAWRSRTSFASD